MMNSASKPSRIDFSKIDISKINQILKTGELTGLSPAEREYFALMELVRGLRARMLFPGGSRLVTKAGIIKLLKNSHGLSDWMARQVYEDAINFFYSESTVSPKAWANLYAEKLEKMADLAFASGKFKDGRALMADAAKLRGCFEVQPQEIPMELLESRPAIIYTTDARALGAPAADRVEIEEFIESLEIPAAARNRALEDAGVIKKDFRKRLVEDVKEFTDLDE